MRIAHPMGLTRLIGNAMALRITLRQLEYFVAVGQCGSIVLAAEKVNVSSPSISAAITQLEAEFGLQLFNRRYAQGMSLTQGGVQLMAQANDILKRSRGLADLANDIMGKVRGPLNVGCLVTFAQIVLPQLRRSFVDLWPDVQFHQFERDQQAIFDGLRDAELDIALTYDLEIPADLDFIPLIDLPPFALLDEAHVLAGRSSVSPADLRDYPMILLDLPMSSDYFLSLFDAYGVKPVITERTRDIAVMRSLVANGFGYSVANIRPLTDLSPDGRRLRFVPLTGKVRTLRLGLLTLESARQSLTNRTFIEHAQARITPDSAPGMAVLPPHSG